MLRWLRALANQLKAGWEWYVILATAVGLPSATVIAAYFGGLSWAER